MSHCSHNAIYQIQLNCWFGRTSPQPANIPREGRWIFLFIIGLGCFASTFLFFKSDTIKFPTVFSCGQQDVTVKPGIHPMMGCFETLIVAQLKMSEKLYRKYIDKRKRTVPSPSTYNSPPGQLEIYIWDNLIPTFACPYSIQRIGNLGDGGKYICGFEFYDRVETNHPILMNKERCIVYSFGVFSESSFEAEVLKRSDCSIFAYDASVDSIGPQVSRGEPRVKFFKSFLKSEGNQTLGHFMRQNGHKWIDILKIDIEGDEVVVLNQILDEFKDSSLPFGQMQIEIHVNPSNSSSFSLIYHLWERMESAGLRPFKNEINPGSFFYNKKNMHAVEFSMLNIGTPSRLIPKSFAIGA